MVVDVSNSPSFEDAAVMEFFKTSTGNLLAAEAAAGVGHHVALSVVGTDRLTESGYFRAKLAQEKLIEGSSIPYSIVHATQFYEFMKRIAADATDGNTVRLPPALIQPMAADDVASAVGRVAVGAPLNGMVEVAGPEQFRLDELIRGVLTKRDDPREVVTDPEARYFGINPSERALLPVPTPAWPRPASATGSHSSWRPRSAAYRPSSLASTSSLLKRGELLLEAGHRVAVQESPQLTRATPSSASSASDGACGRRMTFTGPPTSAMKRRSASVSHRPIGYTQSTPASR